MGQFNYVREKERPIASVIVCARDFVKPEEAIQPAGQDEVKPDPVLPAGESEAVIVEDNKDKNPEVIKDETWTDPEPQPQTNIIVARIAALLSVKSLITIALTVAFIVLVVNGQELPDQFVSIYTMCISFFFGYQFKKAEGKE